jgi:hypothetical protein
MAASHSLRILNPNDYLGEELRLSLIDRLPEIRTAFAKADPSNTGFISKYDFRQALYVDAGVSYADLMKIVKVCTRDRPAGDNQS